MRHTLKHTSWKRHIGGIVAATGLVACLTGCEIAGFTLPDIPLPEIQLPQVDIPFLDGTTERSEALQALSASPALTAPVIREAGVLTVGVNSRACIAPMIMQGGDGAQLTGMDVDVAAALADELGLRVRFVAVDNTDAAVASQVDVVLSATTDNVESAAIVGSYAESGLAFFHKGEQTVVDVSALQGATVGVQPGSASAAALSHTALGMVETSYPTLNDAFEALEAGEVSYVLCDAYAGAYLATTYADITPAGCIDTPLARGVAVDPSNTSLQQAVQQGMDAISSNGILNYIRARWVGAMPRLTADQQIANIPMAEETQPTDDAATADGATDGTASADATASGA